MLGVTSFCNHCYFINDDFSLISIKFNVKVQLDFQSPNIFFKSFICGFHNCYWVVLKDLKISFEVRDIFFIGPDSFKLQQIIAKSTCEGNKDTDIYR